MRSILRIAPLQILAGIALLPSLYAQCPSNVGDFTNGGTFSGDCTLNVNGTVAVTGPVIWTSGTLTINDSGPGGDGDLFINFGGSITIESGARLVMDDGDITINDGGSLSIESGGVVEVMDTDREMYVEGGTLYVTGTLQVREDLEINDGSIVHFYSGAEVDAGDDIIVNDGSSLTMHSGTEVNVGNDLEVYDGSQMTIANGSVVNVADEFFIDDSDVTIAGTVQSTSNDDINISGTSTLTIENGAQIDFNDMEFGTGDGVTQVIMNGGNLNLAGEVDFNNGQDNDAIVVNGGLFAIGNDVELGATNGTITINSGGTVSSPSIDGNTYTLEEDLPSNIIINGSGIFVLDGVPLPVEWVSFQGQLDPKNGLLLTWVTASELNNLGFHIEKSLDGSSFTRIGFVEGAGNSSELLQYRFHDASFSEKAYYRLKQVDFDGAYAYSKVIFISSGKISEPVRLYPNPVHNELRLSGNWADAASILLTNMEGRVLLFIPQEEVVRAHEKLNAVVPGIPAGLYLLVIENSSGKQVIRVTKS